MNNELFIIDNETNKNEPLRIGGETRLVCENVIISPEIEVKCIREALALEMEAKESALARLACAEDKASFYFSLLNELCDCVPVGYDKPLDKKVADIKEMLKKR